MACGSVDGGDPDGGGGGGDIDGGGGGNIDAGGGGNPDATPCADADNDTVCDADDVCPGSNDLADADSDTVPDGCDICAGFDDTMDTDNDSIPNGCDICMPGDDTMDADNDNVPDDCDVCAGFDDAVDADSDNVPDGCDVCAGFDDMVDADNDNVPDGCDICAGFDDAVDTDNDNVPNGCDQCPGFDDSIDVDNNGVPDDCQLCDVLTEVEYQGNCYYLDGSGGSCDAGYMLAPQSVFSQIASDFVGKTYKNQASGNCCIVHQQEAAEAQDWGMETDCNAAGPFAQGPVAGGAGCSDVHLWQANQLTFCMDGTPQELVIDVKEVNGNVWRGWYVTDGTTPHSSSNDNTITGDYRTGSNSYFVFDVSAVPGTIVDVLLDLELESYLGSDPSEEFSVWDVTTDSATLEADGYSDAIYSDLMTGNQYHPATTITSGDVGSVLAMPLTWQAALSAENANIANGDFSVGVHSNTEPGTYRFSNGSEQRIHRITVQYVP